MHLRLAQRSLSVPPIVRRCPRSGVHEPSTAKELCSFLRAPLTALCSLRSLPLLTGPLLAPSSSEALPPSENPWEHTFAVHPWRQLPSTIEDTQREREAQGLPPRSEVAVTKHRKRLQSESSSYHRILCEEPLLRAQEEAKNVASTRRGLGSSCSLPSLAATRFIAPAPRRVRAFLPVYACALSRPSFPSA